MPSLSWFDKLAFLVIVGYFIIFSVISINRYWQYQSYYLDFGIYDEALWKVAHFKAPMIDKGPNGRLNLGDHFTPGMYLLVPIYWISDRREIMFIAQVLAVSVAAWVGYIIAKIRTKNRWFQITLITSFLGFVGLQNALITDIHEISFAVLPLMLAFLSIEKKRWHLYILFIFLLLSFKENMAGMVIGLGLYLLLRYRTRYLKQAIASIVIGLGWGVLTTFVIIPFIGGGQYSYAPLHLEGLGISEIVLQFLSGTEKFKTVFYTLANFGFLPVFDISIWPLALEHYFERFVLSASGNRFTLGYHYNSIIVPVMFMGALNTFGLLRRKVSQKTVKMLSLGIAIWVMMYGRFINPSPIHLLYNKAFYDQRKSVVYQDEFVKIFPNEGLVLTQNDLAVRLTHGPDIRLLREDFVSLNPDYVILNLTPGQSLNSYYPVSYATAIKIRNYYLAETNYTLTKVHEEQYLFAKKR